MHQHKEIGMFTPTAKTNIILFRATSILIGLMIGFFGAKFFLEPPKAYDVLYGTKMERIDFTHDSTAKPLGMYYLERKDGIYNYSVRYFFLDDNRFIKEVVVEGGIFDKHRASSQARYVIRNSTIHLISFEQGDAELFPRMREAFLIRHGDGALVLPDSGLILLPEQPFESIPVPGNTDYPGTRLNAQDLALMFISAVRTTY